MTKIWVTYAAIALVVALTFSAVEDRCAEKPASFPARLAFGAIWPLVAVIVFPMVTVAGDWGRWKGCELKRENKP